MAKDSQTKRIFIRFDDLLPYSKHPFKLYTGQRLDDMVSSIHANGILQDPIVRPHPTIPNKFETLAGHNRCNAGKAAGLFGAECLLKEGLTDEEAYLYVIETNLYQRSFADFSISERAAILDAHFNVMKCQGKRNDIVEEIRNIMAHDGNSNVKATSSPVGTKLRTAEALGEQYGLARTEVARYIRLNSLIDSFKEILDTGELSIRAGYSISFLIENQQVELYNYIVEAQLKITMKQGEAVKRLAESDNFNATTLDEVFYGKPAQSIKPKSIVNLAYKRQQLNMYFAPDDTEEIIATTILEALEFYKQYNGKIQIIVTDGRTLEPTTVIPQPTELPLQPVNPTLSVEILPEEETDDVDIVSDEEADSIMDAMKAFM